VDRYAQPTAEELETMFHEPTAGECFDACKHRNACLRLLEKYENVEIDAGLPWCDLIDKLADMLGCEDCEEYE
jgi:hypothetical protein